MITNPNIEPQTCKVGTDVELANLEGKWIAQEKFDGHRAIMYIKDGKAYFYSRRTSDVTGKKEDNTDRLYYLSNLSYPSILDDTILDGELISSWTHTDSSIVQQVLGSTPERAKELWESGCRLEFMAFDVIALQGNDLTDLPFVERLEKLCILQDYMEKQGIEGIKFAKVYIDKHFNLDNINPLFTQYYSYVDNYPNLLNEILIFDGEGLILKAYDSPYEFKRSKNWLKFKAVKTADLVIMSFVPPKKEYTGKFTKEELIERGWQYWEDGEPVSKTYAKGWVAGIRLGAYKNGKLKYVTTAKGFSDDVQETIKHDDLSNVVVEVEYQGIINPDTKSLRHPRFKMFRYNKNIEDCKWEDIS